MKPFALYSKNDKSVFGKQDFLIKGKKIAIYCDGEFWHRKDRETHKGDHNSNTEFWYPKIERNIERDKGVHYNLNRKAGKCLGF